MTILNKLIAEKLYELSFLFCKNTHADISVLAYLWLNQLSYILIGSKSENSSKKDEFITKLNNILSVEDAETLKAVSFLCDFLEKYNLQQSSGAVQQVDFPSRHTDWPLTYQNKLTAVPLVYYEKKHQLLDDDMPLRALLGLLRKRRSFLEGRQDVVSIEKIKKALEPYESKRYSSIPMTLQNYNRLVSAYPEIKEALYLLKAIFNKKISDKTKDNSKEKVEALLLELFKKEANADFALELISRYAIINAARENGWSYDETPSMPAEAKLTLGERCCFITKGSPLNIVKKLGHSAEFYRDRFSQKMNDWGLQSQVSGKQPDIVLVFYNQKNILNQIKMNKLRFVFADAKNNQNLSDGGLGYIRSAIGEMFKYMFSYGHIFQGGIDFSRSEGWSLYFSLFVSQLKSRTEQQIEQCAVDIIVLDNLARETEIWWEKVSGREVENSQVTVPVKIIF